MLLFLPHPLLLYSLLLFGEGGDVGELQDGEVGRHFRNLLSEGTEREQKLRGLPSLSRTGVRSFLP